MYSIVKYSKAKNKTIIFTDDKYDRKRFNRIFTREKKTLNIGEMLELERDSSNEFSVDFLFTQKRKDGFAEIRKNKFKFIPKV